MINKSIIHFSATILSVALFGSATHATTTKTESHFDFSKAELVPELSNELFFDPTSRLSIFETPAQRIKGGLTAAYEHVSNNRVIYGTAATIAAGTLASMYLLKPRRAGEGNALGRIIADAAAPAAVFHGNGNPPALPGDVPGASHVETALVPRQDPVLVDESVVKTDTQMVEVVASMPAAELTPMQTLLVDLNREFGELFGRILPGADQLARNFDVDRAPAAVVEMLRLLDGELAPKVANNNNISEADRARMQDFRGMLRSIARELDKNHASPPLERTPSPEAELGDDWAVVGRELEEQVETVIPARLVYRHGEYLALHPIFTQQTYDDLRMIASLSYKVAVEFRAPKEADRERAIRLKKAYLQKLRENGWQMFAIVDGKTGRFNRDDDKVAIVLVNTELNIAVLAFHGSINFDYGILNLWHGDWASNWDSVAQDARDFGIEDAEGVQLHRGFANNYMSARQGILDAIFKAIDTLQPQAEGAQNAVRPTLFVVGHSNGAAKATIAAPDVQTQLRKAGRDVHVIAMPISAPKAVTASGEVWARRVLGVGNIVRVNVHRDVAPKQPWLIGKLLGMSKFVSVGLLVLDNINDVNARAKALGRLLSRMNGETWAGYHYGSCTDGASDWEFDHELMVSYDDFLRILHIGVAHQVAANPDLMKLSILGGVPLGQLPEDVIEELEKKE